MRYMYSKFSKAAYLHEVYWEEEQEQEKALRRDGSRVRRAAAHTGAVGVRWRMVLLLWLCPFCIRNIVGTNGGGLGLRGALIFWPVLETGGLKKSGLGIKS